MINKSLPAPIYPHRHWGRPSPDQIVHPKQTRVARMPRNVSNPFTLIALKDANPKIDQIKWPHDHLRQFANNCARASRGRGSMTFSDWDWLARTEWSNSSSANKNPASKGEAGLANPFYSNLIFAPGPFGRRMVGSSSTGFGLTVLGARVVLRALRTLGAAVPSEG